jgi:hypothetical protein
MWEWTQSVWILYAWLVSFTVQPALPADPFCKWRHKKQHPSRSRTAANCQTRIRSRYLFDTRYIYICHGAIGPSGPGPPHYRGFTITLRHTSHSVVGLLWTRDQSDRGTSDNTQQKRQMSLTPAWFEPTIPASARPQTHALDRAATGIGATRYISSFIYVKSIQMSPLAWH